MKRAPRVPPLDLTPRHTITVQVTREWLGGPPLGAVLTITHTSRVAGWLASHFLTEVKR